MLRKLFVRLFRCFIVLVGIVILSGCIAGYFAFQQPAFYADLRAQQFSQSDQLAAKAFFQQMAADLTLWSDRSLSLQRAQGPGNYDPAQDTHSVCITQQQLNAQLASIKTNASREVQNPRIRIGQDHIDLGIEVVTPKATCILSAKLKLASISDGRLRLELETARIGQLPIPLRAILRWLPRKVYSPGSDLELDLTAPTPYVCLNVSGKGSAHPAVKSVKCAEGQMTIEFLPPVLSHQQDERRATALALPRRN